MAISLKDIAARARVSAMTVSRALRGAPGVGEKLRLEIEEMAKEMGYVPNRIASNLVTRRTQTIGVVVPTLDRFFPQVVMSMEDELSAAGYQNFVCCSQDHAGKEFRQVTALLERRVDGIILASVSMEESMQALTLAARQDCPVVLIDRLIPDAGVDSVSFDDYEGSKRVVQHLADNGFSKIAHIAGPQGNWVAQERLRGYVEGMKALGLKVPKGYIVDGGLHLPDGAVVEQLLDCNVPPDAIFCANDLVALGVYGRLAAKGIAVPDEIAIAGFGCILDTDFVPVPITTMLQDTGKLGRKAAQLLLKRIETPDFAKFPPVSEVIETHLVARASTGAEAR